MERKAHNEDPVNCVQEHRHLFTVAAIVFLTLRGKSKEEKMQGQATAFTRDGH